MGTGTCIVFYNNGKNRHLIGTGVGGGTIIGLSKLLLKEARIEKLNSLALRGNLKKIDLQIHDITGSSFSMLNGNATASNFAKLQNFAKADLAAGIQNLVAESVAVLAVSASEQCACNTIVFCGRAPLFPFVNKRLNSAARCFSKNFLYPKDSEFATAIGAALVVHGK
jgi:type II pantothenate kinase